MMRIKRKMYTLVLKDMLDKAQELNLTGKQKSQLGALILKIERGL